MDEFIKSNNDESVIKFINLWIEEGDLDMVSTICDDSE